MRVCVHAFEHVSACICTLLCVVHACSEAAVLDWYTAEKQIQDNGGGGGGGGQDFK